MGTKFSQWRGSYLSALESILVQLSVHRGHSTFLDCPSLDGEMIVRCTDCQKVLVSGSAELIQGVYTEFLFLGR